MKIRNSDYHRKTSVYYFGSNYTHIFLIYLIGCGADIHVIPKIESADSIPNLHSIIAASDGV